MQSLEYPEQHNLAGRFGETSDRLAETRGMLGPARLSVGSGVGRFQAVLQRDAKVAVIYRDFARDLPFRASLVMPTKARQVAQKDLPQPGANFLFRATLELRERALGGDERVLDQVRRATLRPEFVV